MGAFGEAFAAFAQPMIDQTDGSMEQVQKALSLSQLCYNTGLLPADKREEMFAEFRSSLDMDDDEFDDFRRSVLDPMIARHEEMMRVSSSAAGPSPRSGSGSLALQPRAAAPARKSTVDRYAPCPCNSGKKYKFCCGAKGG